MRDGPLQPAIVRRKLHTLAGGPLFRNFNLPADPGTQGPEKKKGMAQTIKSQA